MFVEFHTVNPKTGWIEVICGSMFSGKTEELIRRLRRAQIANQPVQIFKPTLDKRYDESDIVSHNQNALSSIPISSAEQILLLASESAVIGIDEAQFFDKGLTSVAGKLADQGNRVIIAGLDMDYRGKPFGPMPELLAMAEFVTKVHAICQRCGSLANFSYRLQESETQLLLGEKDAYEPRCRRCYQLKEKASDFPSS